MQFALTDEQRSIQESAATFLAETAGIDRLRAVLESPAGWDEQLWGQFVGEMGFGGLMVPEAYGGTGLSAVEMALVLEETGRRLAVAPFFETAVLAVQAMLAGGNASQKLAFLPPIAAGKLKATLAFNPTAEGFTPRLEGADGAWRLHGAAGFVSFADTVDLLLVVAQGSQAGTSGTTLLALPTATAGVVVRRQPGLDPTRPFCHVSFESVVVPVDAVLGMPGQADAIVNHVLAVGAGLLAAEQTGGAAYCLSSTVEYVQQRVQFGRAIGSFQAVKHTLADMMVQVEASRSANLYAAAAIAQDSEELYEASSAARAWCSEAYKWCAGEAIQLHGGIGFTWEHHAHLYFKRARSSSTWFGSPELHREKIARIIGLGPSPETP